MLFSYTERPYSIFSPNQSSHYHRIIWPWRVFHRTELNGRNNSQYNPSWKINGKLFPFRLSNVRVCNHWFLKAQLMLSTSTLNLENKVSNVVFRLRAMLHKIVLPPKPSSQILILIRACTVSIYTWHMHAVMHLFLPKKCMCWRVNPIFCQKFSEKLYVRNILLKKLFMFLWYVSLKLNLVFRNLTTIDPFFGVSIRLLY